MAAIHPVDPMSGGGDQRALLQRWSSGLGRLVEVGRQIVQTICAQIAPFGLRRQFSSLGTAYERVSWALRLIAALQLKLERDAKALERAEHAGETDRPRTARREGRERESSERFDPDGFGRLLRRPVEDVVAVIRDVLGFTPELRRIVDAAWASDEAFETALDAEERPPRPQSDPSEPVGSLAPYGVAPAGPS